MPNNNQAMSRTDVIWNKIFKKNGQVRSKCLDGFTMYLYGLNTPKTRNDDIWCVAYSDTQNCFGREGLQKAIDHAATHFQIIGGWYDTKENKYYFDSVILFTKKETAVEFAIREGQKGIFHIPRHKPEGRYIEIIKKPGKTINVLHEQYYTILSRNRQRRERAEGVPYKTYVKYGKYPD